MHKRTSTLEESEFIQGGSHDDANTNAHANINSVQNIAVGDCDSTECKLSLNNNQNTIDLKTEQEERDELPLLSCLSYSTESDDISAEESSAATTAVTLEASESSPKPKTLKSVSFSHCSIRSYNQILGDHPLCAVGCPLALGWKVVREEALSVDDYETIREPLRKKKGLKSPSQHRRKVYGGHSPMEASFKYLNSQLKLSAEERREKLSDYSDTLIRKEWSRRQKQSRRGLIKEGMRQFRQVGAHYAGY
ncbi:unnamed protein product [Cylindrotheca closterium]|uniref:Uncharacterized protein n=1 Tax=Cylindrotheca closterium TaxID=2856 RepID=A0AAD2FQX2_9STRA|nr:unnamed protein product [Cylindrotheca closterium]